MISKQRLVRAAGGGALVGAVVLVLNVVLQGQLAAAGVGAVALMMIGGALGGAVLFMFIAIVTSLLSR
jgi:hypothetical protein